MKYKHFVFDVDGLCWIADMLFCGHGRILF